MDAEATGDVILGQAPPRPQFAQAGGEMLGQLTWGLFLGLFGHVGLGGEDSSWAATSWAATRRFVGGNAPQLSALDRAGKSGRNAYG